MNNTAEHDPTYLKGNFGSKEQLCALINVCQAMHVIYMRQEGDALGMYPASLLNPAELCCTCKGFRVSCNCSHTVAVTAMYLKEEHCVPGRRPFDAAFLEALLEKLPTTRRRSHRPLGIRPGNRFQPTTDLVDEDTPEEEEGEEEEESEEGEELTEEWERYGCGDKRRRKTVP